MIAIKRFVNIMIIAEMACLILSGIASSVFAQTASTNLQDTVKTLQDTTQFISGDTILSPFSDSVIVSFDAETRKALNIKNDFKPNPNKAVLYAAIFPGLGQIYNRQYWKLPIVYGGLMGCLYAITWNNKNYQDYKNAYFDIMGDVMNDPNAEHPENWGSWQDFIPARSSAESYLRNSSFQNQLKSGKDFYRRYRDLSIIISVAVYGILIADAYVDAQMFDFDVSPNLAIHIVPEYMPSTINTYRSFGVNISIDF